MCVKKLLAWCQTGSKASARLGIQRRSQVCDVCVLKECGVKKEFPKSLCVLRLSIVLLLFGLNPGEGAKARFGGGYRVFDESKERGRILVRVLQSCAFVSGGEAEPVCRGIMRCHARSARVP